MNRNLWFLTILQGLFLTNNVALIAINGLVGLSLAPKHWMATLPVAGYVIGGALSTGLVALTQARFGRKRSFQIGLLVAVVSALMSVVAAVTKDFWLLSFATLVAGYYNANANLYRFAAAELSAPEWRDKAVSLVMAGGLIGGILGPNLSAQTRGLLHTPFVGTYLALVVVAILSLILISFVEFPTVAAKRSGHAGRPLGQILRQPVFIVAATTSALGYGVMNLLMAATPMAMQMNSFSFSDTAIVIEWHVIGMFAPGFVTGHLIKKFGTLPILIAGVVLNFLCITVALSGVNLSQFLIALFLLGLGWNFLFTASTTLSLQTYMPEEKDRAQGALNFITFVMLALTALFSGALITTSGWNLLNYLSAALMLITAAAIAWLSIIQKKRLPSGHNVGSSY